jgi:DNA-binding response OmpR family regulator
MVCIVVADSDYSTLESVCLAVEGEGYEAVRAMDGLEAYEAAVSRQADLVMLDVALPIFNGFEVSERLRSGGEFPAETSILLMSSKEQDVRAVMRVGAADCLDKQTLLPMVREILSKYLGQKAGR